MRTWALAIGIVLLTVFAYQPAWYGGPLWDDDAHLTPVALQSAEGLKRIWLEPTATQQYYPVTHSLFWITARTWGHSPLPQHLLNILLHAGSALLIAAFMRRVGLPGPFLAAAIFAVHPVHVESVAWMSELKNVLSGFFALSSAVMYLRFLETRRVPAYLGALILFLLAVLSKSVTATLPAALLVVLWWRNGRLSWRTDVVPLLPLFGVGLAAGLGTIWIEYHLIGARGDAFELSFVERILLAGRALWFYLQKLIWPVSLSFVYPRWSVDSAIWWQYLFPAVVIGLGFALWRLREWSRGPLAAFLIYGGTLFPALGFFNVYPFRFSYVADHFQYHASIAIIVWAAATVGASRRWYRNAYRAAAIALVCVLTAMTWSQSHAYASAETLYRTTLERNPRAWMAHTNLAALLLRAPATSEVQAAISHASEAARLNPSDAQVRYNLALALTVAGRVEEATIEYQRTLQIEPRHAKARNNYASLLALQGRKSEALEEYRQALVLAPGNAEVRINLGKLLSESGRSEEAVRHLREAVIQAPEVPEAHLYLGIALMRGSQPRDALMALERASKLSPEDARAWRALGQLHLQLGAPHVAVSSYREALRRAPADAAIHNELGVALARTGAHRDAVTHYRTALQHDPRLSAARINLGLAYAAIGELDQSLRWFNEALAEHQSDADLHYDTGVVLVRLGRLTEAVQHFASALRIDPAHEDARNALLRLKDRSR